MAGPVRSARRAAARALPHRRSGRGRVPGDRRRGLCAPWRGGEAAGRRDPAARRVDWVAEACDERPMRYGAYTPETLIWSMLGTEDHCVDPGPITSVPVRTGVSSQSSSPTSAPLPCRYFRTPCAAAASSTKSERSSSRPLRCCPATRPWNCWSSTAESWKCCPPSGKPPCASRIVSRDVAARIGSMDHPNRSQLAGAFRQDAIPLDSVLAGLSEADRAAFERIWKSRRSRRAPRCASRGIRFVSLGRPPQAPIRSPRRPRASG